MNRQDLELEGFPVPKAVPLTLHRFDLVVDSLHRATSDYHLVVRQQAATAQGKYLGDLLEHPDSRGHLLLNLAVEEVRHKSLAGLLPEPP